MYLLSDATSRHEEQVGASAELWSARVLQVTRRCGGAGFGVLSLGVEVVANTCKVALKSPAGLELLLGGLERETMALRGGGGVGW